MTTVKPTDVTFAGAAEQARMLAAGTITAPALVEMYLERINRLDSKLGAYRVVLADSARVEAAAAQQRLDAGERLALLGVPVAIKDDVDIADQVTAIGTAAYGPPKSADAEVVRRLREAGAVILGKTAVPELCIWPFTESVTYGATRNPWDTSRAPGGSSGGTAVAVAAGMAAVGLGSDGGGSIRVPSTWCGLFGIKPQRDRVSLSPHDNAWQGMSANGPLARTVEDAALFLDATAASAQPNGGFVAAAKREPGRLRIALSTKVPPPLYPRVGENQRAAVREAGAVLRDLGHQVITRDPQYPIAAVAGNFMPRALRGIYDDAALLPRPENLEARTRGVARAGALFSDQRMGAIHAKQEAVSAKILSIFDDIDILITPGTSAGPPRVGAYRRCGPIATVALGLRRVPFTPPFNVTGQPAAVVPWGLGDDGLPLSIQLVSRPFDEATLLAVSSQIEAARPWAGLRPPGAFGAGSLRT